MVMAEKKKDPTLGASADKSARKVRILACFYLQIEYGKSVEEAHRILSGLPVKERIKLAEKGDDLLMRSLEKRCDPLQSLDFVRKAKRNSPREYKKMMAEVKKRDPGYYDHLVKLHSQV